MKHKAHILLTGFGPFPGVPENASAELAARLAAGARRRFPRREFTVETLPTEWVAGPRRLAQLYSWHKPILALHFGVSEKARGFVIETIGRNECRQAKDACGALPRGTILNQEAPGTLPVTLPVARIVARLRALNIPAQLSNDAGGYLCNAVLFNALSLADTPGRATAAGFIHIPANIKDWAPFEAGAMEILRTCLSLTELNRQG